MLERVTCAVVLLLAAFSMAEVSGNVQFCSSRVFAGYNGTVLNDETGCPYFLESEEWAPGIPTKMTISQEEGKPFQLFIVSVQLGNSLIGEMSSNDMTAEATCANSSLKHADLVNKTVVTLTWTAPLNLAADDLPFVRLSIGTENTYWRGCEIFYLDRKVDEETTTNPRIAPPDNADSNNASTTMNSSSSGSTSTNSLSMSIAETTTSSRPLSCQQYGNTYSVIPNTDCKEFKQTAGSQEFFLKCPAGLRFDTRHCVCSFTQECDL
ncbi:hypothetical protein EB796_006298 [Bugula neritina]|uniref:Reelin domain-containing protein n=1 Tax=Bugula neritina TaxID=10212 RepID=A0A7J7KCX4_BUGNE|nr:hypothetical protein EB796_006298 [Bugula neritina]